MKPKFLLTPKYLLIYYSLQCADKVNSVIDFVVNYVKALDAHELCSKIGNCDEEDMPELEVELGGC